MQLLVSLDMKIELLTGLVSLQDILGLADSTVNLKYSLTDTPVLQETLVIQDAYRKKT